MTDVSDTSYPGARWSFRLLHLAYSPVVGLLQPLLELLPVTRVIWPIVVGVVLLCNKDFILQQHFTYELQTQRPVLNTLLSKLQQSAALLV